MNTAIDHLSVVRSEMQAAESRISSALMSQNPGARMEALFSEWSRTHPDARDEFVLALIGRIAIGG